MSFIRKFSAGLNDRAYRFRLYGMLSLGFFLLAHVIVFAKPTYNFVVSDGRGYYVYLPTVLIDGDLDLKNQIDEHWDVDFSNDLIADKTPAGFIRNKYPIGLSLSLLPGFVVAHGLSHVAYALSSSKIFSPDGYSVLYQIFCVGQIMLLGLIMMRMVDALLRKHWGVSGRICGLAIPLFWIGSHYSYYYFREPMMIHAVSAFWVTAVVYFACRWRTLDDTKPQQNLVLFAAMLFSFAMAGVCRPTNVFLLPFVIYIILEARFRMLNTLKTGPLRMLAALLVVAAPIALQLTTWKIMNGQWISYSYNDEGFFWDNPYLISSLFSSRHGLFFWSPLLLLSIVGLCFKLQKTAAGFPIGLIPLVLGALILWYFNASWHVWWFGDAFGARAFLELALLFIAGLAFFLEKMQQWRRRYQVAGMTFVGLAIVYQYGLMALYIARKIPRADYLF